MDCDRAGREAARRIKRELSALSEVSVLDLDPGREDGYDLTDALLDQAHHSGPAAPISWLRRARAAARVRDPRGIER